MATVDHCLFCFETLVAELERRKSLSLQEVQDSYSEYVKTLDAEEEESETGDDAPKSQKLSKQLPALRRLAASSSSASSNSSSASVSSVSLDQQTSVADTPATSVSSLPITAEYPLFVTWNTITRSGHNLRGCIGTFEALPLEEGLSSYAVTSAFHDTRFNPISARELPSLEVAVTLLTDFEDCDDEMDWILGTHGIRISFYYHGRRYGATYLPDVATEQGWTKEETLVSLMRKAGWMGRKERWQDVELKVVRYQGKKESLKYSEFKRWRKWVDASKVKA
ncbi:AMMECR1 domain-containing protein [Pleurostoma richardsiae]|uniref:AMMECR1 domain-containing protein n=1 Tax=Pleurostoma richardsiae TaxID=41990 RepID=A0AA38RV02_9PEZI|nr:AMMECR1 domain-containing protein [Pleurostoma richardsiae]